MQANHAETQQSLPTNKHLSSTYSKEIYKELSGAESLFSCNRGEKVDGVESTDVGAITGNSSVGGGGGGGGGGGDDGGGDGGGDGDVGLKVGDRVNVVGLKSATHQQHNGSTGTVLGAQAAKGRYVVQLDAGKGEKPLDLALKPANCCKRL